MRAARSGRRPSRDRRWTEIGRRRASGRGGAGAAGAEPGPGPVHEQPVLYPERRPGLRRAEDLVRPWADRPPSPGRWRAASRAYTLLLATTACVLIRLGRLWDDLRTLLLLIVMMFLAIAMSCDDTLTGHPGRGIAGMPGRAGLRGGGHRGGAAHDPASSARVVSRGLLRDPRPGVPLPGGAGPAAGRPGQPGAAMGAVRLRADRGAGGVIADPGGAARAGGHGGERQPLAMAAVSLVAVRRDGGRPCASDRGRSASRSTMSTGSHSIFGTYFLVPIGMAVALVWLEIGIAARRKGIMTPPRSSRWSSPAWRWPGTANGVGLPAVPGTLHPDARGFAGLPDAARDRGLPGVCGRPARAEGLELLALALAGLAVVGPRTVDLSRSGDSADRADGRGGARARRDRVAAARLAPGPARRPLAS